MAKLVDKLTFLNLAPEYYMLALYIHLQTQRQHYSDTSWRKDFTWYVEGGRNEGCYVENEALRKEALKLMAAQGAIVLIEDHFGPTIWQKTIQLEPFIGALEKSPANVFYKARVSGDPRRWLIEALDKVNAQAKELGITSEDFAPPSSTGDPLQGTATVEDSPVDEWEPIKIDPSEEVVAEATKRLSEVTESIEQDNGYAATHPQERDLVVTDLKGGLEKIQSGETSVAWMKRTITALRIVSIRFVNTVKGQAIDGTLAAIKELTRTKMQHAFEFLWSLFS